MKTNELMIGDWVEQKVPNKPRYRQIGLSDLYKIKIHSDLCLEDNGELKVLFPISLTPEILEKNGFEQDYSYDECVADGCFVEVKGWSYKAENILIQWDGITCGITNDLGVLCEEVTLNDGYTGGIKVHELQHALRLCGLDDLADNFKV